MVSPKEFDKGMTRFHELFNELLEDIYKSFEVLESDKCNQSLRRNTVRTVFSAIEGMLSIVRDEILKELRSHSVTDSITVSPKEMELLNEKKMKNGIEINYYPGLSDRVKKYFIIASKVFSLDDHTLDTGGHEFRSFEIARNTRDRLTHPRDFYDIQITDTEMHHLVTTMSWVREGMLSLYRARIRKARSEMPEWALEGWDELFKHA